MTSVGSSLVELAAQLLQRDERQAVLGDLVEDGENAWQGLLDVLSLVLHRQAILWKSWRPWLAAFGLTVPGSFVLMGTSVAASMFQAHLPDPGNPPLFIDLLARQEGDQLIIDAKLMERFRNNFYLETMIPQYTDNLKSLRGLKFDWTRNDPNFDHVYANQAFTHKLNEFGIIHGAEEYNRTFGADWGIDGRFYTDALPFFQKLLVFESHKQTGRD
ncbi:MAG TPA: hypothetical protein VF123_20220 [Candidatus Sulfotelmatobacter sp.]